MVSKFQSAGMWMIGRWLVVLVCIVPTVGHALQNIVLTPGEMRPITLEEQLDMGLTGQNISILFPEGEQQTVVSALSGCNQELIITGKQPGQTELVFCDELGAQVKYRITVRNPVAQQARMLLESFPTVTVLEAGEQVLVDGVVGLAEDYETIDAICTTLKMTNLVIVDTTQYDSTLVKVLENRLRLPEVSLTLVKGRVLLEGRVSALADKQRAEMLVGQYFPVVSMLEVDLAESSKINSELIRKHLSTLPGIEVDYVGDMIRLSGSVFDQNDVDHVMQIATSYIAPDKIINALEILPPMVEMDVIIAEVSWGDYKSIGDNTLFNSVQVNLDGTISFDNSYTNKVVTTVVNGVETIYNNTGDSGAVTSIDVPQHTNKREQTRTFDDGNTSNQDIKVSAQTKLNALLSANCARIIGRPHVSCRSGEEAYIQVGGSFGVPVVTNNTSNIDYKDYGTIVTIQPVVHRNGHISGYVKVERSNQPMVVSFSGQQAVNQDRTMTYAHISCQQGQTVVLSGLVDEYESDSTSKTPFLNRVPIVNMLFKKVEKSLMRTELVVLVTPTVPTIVTNKMVPFSQGYERTLQQATIYQDRLNLRDNTLTDFILSREPEEWPCRGPDPCPAVPICPYSHDGMHALPPTDWDLYHGSYNDLRSNADGGYPAFRY